MVAPLTRTLNSIFTTKENLMREEGNLFLKDYIPYVINRCLAKHRDTRFYAELLNRHPDIPKEEHYEFLLYSIPKKKRFARLKKPEENPDIDIIKRHYGYNDDRAKEALRILTKDQIEEIKEKYINE